MDDELYIKVQRTGDFDPQDERFQPRSHQVLMSLGDWIAVEYLGPFLILFQRSTGLQSSKTQEIIEGLEQVPEEYFSPSLKLTQILATGRVLERQNAKELAIDSISSVSETACTGSI